MIKATLPLCIVAFAAAMTLFPQNASAIEGPPTGVMLRDNAAAAYLAVSSNRISEVTQLFAGNTAIVYAQYFPERFAGAISVMRLELDPRRTAVLRTDFLGACELRDRFSRSNGVLTITGTMPFQPFCDPAPPQDGWYANVQLGSFLAAVSTVMRMAQSQAGYVQIGAASVGSNAALGGDDWGRNTAGSAAAQLVRPNWFVAQTVSTASGATKVLRPQFETIGCSGAPCARLASGTGYVFVPYQGGNLAAAQTSRGLTNDSVGNTYGPITLYNAVTAYVNGAYRLGGNAGAQQGSTFVSAGATSLSTGSYLSGQGSSSVISTAAGSAYANGAANQVVSQNQRAGNQAVTADLAFFSAMYGGAQAAFAMQRNATAFDATNGVVQSGVSAHGSAITPRSGN